MKEKSIIVKYAGKEKRYPFNEGDTVLDVMRRQGFTHIKSDCGGNGTCGQCKINGNILACKTLAYDGLYAEVSYEGPIRTKERTKDIEPNPRESADSYGVAVDIGTTTVAVYVYCLSSGKCVGTASERNRQRLYGADVILRIQYAAQDEKLVEMRNMIRDQIDSMTASVFREKGIEKYTIKEVSVAGNTVMQHIYEGLSPTTIGVAPFKPLSLFGYRSIYTSAYIAPAVAGYVGGDITAGLLSSGAADEKEKKILFIDIGTNGEMAIGNEKGFTCCATAAGPAFEGAEIEMGMDASVGAICGVEYDCNEGDIKVEVIGFEAKGICGSGLIDAVAAMLRCGVCDESGRLSETGTEKIRARVKDSGDGNMRLYLTDSVYVSSDDIRKIQLAKSAVRAGIETLLNETQTQYKEITSVLIAGGFGEGMSVKSACAIGLLPPEFLYITGHVGNTSGAGAAMALTETGKRRLKEIAGRCKYIELSSSEFFMNKYMSTMYFNEMRKVFPITVKEMTDMAKDFGFEVVTELNPETLHFQPEIRQMCAADTCRSYNKNWSCPPLCGSTDSIAEKCKRFSQGIIFQTVGDIEDSYDFQSIEEVAQIHRDRFGKFREKLLDAQINSFPMSMGACTICKKCAYPKPCRFPELMCISMEACGLDVGRVCKDNGLSYYYGKNKIAFISCCLI